MGVRASRPSGRSTLALDQWPEDFVPSDSPPQAADEHNIAATCEALAEVSLDSVGDTCDYLTRCQRRGSFQRFPPGLSARTGSDGQARQMCSPGSSGVHAGATATPSRIEGQAFALASFQTESESSDRDLASEPAASKASSNESSPPSPGRRQFTASIPTGSATAGNYERPVPIGRQKPV